VDPPFLHDEINPARRRDVLQRIILRRNRIDFPFRPLDQDPLTAA